MRSVDTSNRSKQNARAQSSWHTFAAIKNGAAALSAAGLCINQFTASSCVDLHGIGSIGRFCGVTRRRVEIDAFRDGRGGTRLDDAAAAVASKKQQYH